MNGRSVFEPEMPPIRHFTYRHFKQIFQAKKMSKPVRIYDPAIRKTNIFPAAELAPGMVEAQVEGVGRVWINSAAVKLSGNFKHPQSEPELRDFIEREIQKPLAEVWPKTLAELEDNFRRDAEPEQEIGLWCRIAERFTEFSKS